MSEGLEETLGSGYQQIIIGFIVFIIGAIWGGIQADGEMTASDVYWPAFTMLAGAMITMLGISFGTDHEDDRTNDLMDAINELTAKMDALTSGDKDNSEE
jgi:4-hydroxybenzoate polyprenyltransferase